MISLRSGLGDRNGSGCGRGSGSGSRRKHGYVWGRHYDGVVGHRHVPPRGARELGMIVLHRRVVRLWSRVIVHLLVSGQRVLARERHYLHFPEHVIQPGEFIGEHGPQPRASDLIGPGAVVAELIPKQLLRRFLNKIRINFDGVRVVRAYVIRNISSRIIG